MHCAAFRWRHHGLRQIPVQDFNERPIDPGRRNLAHACGNRSGPQQAMMTIQVLSGISHGAVLFVAAAGLTLTYGILRIANFAHGSLYMLGAFVTFTIVRQFGNSTPTYLAASILAPLAV